MSTISSTSYSNAAYSSMQTQHAHKKPDASKMASDLFSQLDTSNKGYIEESDLTSALSQLSGSSDTSSTSSSDTASQLFSKLDGDGDGKVTQDEMTSGLKKLQEELDSQFNQMRMEGGMGDMASAQGMPPPPPPENDTGFTQDELQSQLDEIGSTDSKRSSLISNIVNNFDQADSNGDGKVTMQEAMAFDQSSQTSSSTASTSSTSTSSTDSSSTSSSSSTTTLSDAQLFKQIMDLMRAYDQDSASQSASQFRSLSSLLSVSA